MAKAFHPDVNNNDPKKAAKFKVIGEAYRILSNPAKRAQYDRQMQNQSYYTAASSANPGYKREAYQRRRDFQFRPYFSKQYTAARPAQHGSPLGRKIYGITLAVILGITLIYTVKPMVVNRTYSNLYFTEGKLLYESGEYNKALNSLDKAIAKFGTSAVKASILACEIMMNEFGEYDYALEYTRLGLDRARMREEKSDLLILQGKCYLGLEEYAKARRSFHRALSVMPYDNYAIHVGLSEIYARYYQDFYKSLFHAEQALSQEKPEHVNEENQLWYLRGLSHQQLGKYSQSIADLKRVKPSSAYFRKAQLVMGYAWYGKNKYSQACSCWEAAGDEITDKVKKLMELDCN